MQLTPPAIRFDKSPPCVDLICEKIERMIGNPVRIMPREPEQASAHFKGRIAFACVPEITVDLWEVPPGYEKNKNIEEPIDSTVDCDAIDALPERTEDWTLVLVRHGVSDDTLIDATVGALEDLGGAVVSPRWNDERRIAASRPRNDAELRRAYRNAKSESRWLTAALILYVAGCILVMAIMAIPFGLYHLGRFCFREVRSGYNS
ncbi:MAG TPA: hypothetical protein P5081_08675 [Phycisphaerae bacterium]|nr:hypothetical protein [Phycisphaerae bacterium]HRW52948.1 hypothetical protein [Phycisphaerae bacterium]